MAFTFLIIAVALATRLINLNQSLWLDEAISVLFSQRHDFWSFVTVYPIGDFHPPLYFGILWVWAKIFGISETVVRLPSVIFGVATVFLVIKICQNLFSRKIALVAGILLALAPLHVYYSQEARMYSLAAFCVALSFYFLTKFIGNPKKYFVFYSLSIILVLYSDYVAYFALLPHPLIYYLYNRKFSPGFLCAILLAFLSLTPWIPVFLKQWSAGGEAARDLPIWANIVGSFNIKNFLLFFVKSVLGRISFENKFLYMLIFGFLINIYIFLTVKAVYSKNKGKFIILIWFSVPLVISYLASFFVPVFSYFRLLYLLPALAILISIGLDNLNKKASCGLLGIILISNIASLLMYYTNPNFQREDWRSALNMLNQLRLSKNYAVGFENNSEFAPFTYYNQAYKLNTLPLLKKVPAEKRDDVEIKQIQQENYEKLYLFEYLMDITDPKRIAIKELEKIGYKNNETFNFEGVGLVRVFSKSNE